MECNVAVPKRPDRMLSHFKPPSPPSMQGRLRLPWSGSIASLWLACLKKITIYRRAALYSPSITIHLA